MLIIGLVGPFNSGKTTAGSYLSKKGFYNIRLSQIIEEEIEKNNHGSIKERKILQDVGNLLRKKFGPQILAERAIKTAKAKHQTKIVIDGIRNVEEINFFKTKGVCVIIGITAGRDLRFKRHLLIGERRTLTPAEFARHEARDKGRGQNKHGLQVAECYDLKDHEIINRGTKKDFYRALDNIIKNL